MRQVLQHLRTGNIEVADVPCPMVRPGHLLVQSTRTLISAGTERSLVEFSQASLIGKARAQPDKVRQVLNKIKTDGLMPTLETVFNRLDEPLPLGYCNVGRVVEVGRGVREFHIGDRIVSNGPHAEMVCVPSTLAAMLPDDVDDDTAAFTVLGSIALHGIRLAKPELGEHFVVTGLGLIGLLAVQILRANGCEVLGIDPNAARCAIAQGFGCKTFTPSEGSSAAGAVEAFSGGRGVDGVIICATAKTDEIVHQAAQMCRKRGRIILVGVVGLNLRRSEFYEKELSFQVSCSYGAGRYDTSYEDAAQDYPLPYVRWTVARNFEAVLGIAARGSLDVSGLISRRVAQADAPKAYETVVGDKSALGVILTYPQEEAPVGRSVKLTSAKAVSADPTSPVVGVIGAGNFSKLVLLPAIRAAGATIESVASAGGVSGVHAGRKNDAAETTSDYTDILRSPTVNTVFIATRHGSHASMVAEALDAGKHVFVEKPLAIDEAGLELVRAGHQRNPQLQLMVGFNRRFAPHAVRVKQLLEGRSQPVAVTMHVNAGELPSDHWLHDREIGGGRIIGEGCHFIDLVMDLVGQPITSVRAVMFGAVAGAVREDTMTIAMSYADGSIGTVHYFSHGGRSYPKERVEILSEGRTLVIDNWRRLTSYDWPGAPKMKMRQDKGHRAEVAAFLRSVSDGGEPLIPFEQLDLVTRATFAAVKSAEDGSTIALDMIAAPQTGSQAGPQTSTTIGAENR